VRPSHSTSDSRPAPLRCGHAAASANKPGLPDLEPAAVAGPSACRLVTLWRGVAGRCCQAKGRPGPTSPSHCGGRLIS
jgi:hypothetical protein